MWHKSAKQEKNGQQTTRADSINVILFGQTGVGKSSVVNLIAQKQLAKVSSGVDGCTMEYTPYDIPFDDKNFTIFDTIGLDESEMGVNGYLKAIEKALELIKRLETAGGIHLLLFCMRAGRITVTTQSNYRLFYQIFCRGKVPVALVFTGLEREADPEDWWREQQTRIEQHYGIKSQGHACITAVHDGTDEELDKYTKSQEKIRDLIKNCALESAAPLPELHSWLAGSAKGMMGFIEQHRQDHARNELTKLLRKNCRIAKNDATKIVDMMEKGDTEPNENETERA